MAVQVQEEKTVKANGHAGTKLQVGLQAPEWTMQGYTPEGKVQEFSSKSLRGKWTVLFFYPLDFTPVCETEVDGFKNLHQEFKNLNAEVFGVSIDSVFTHKAWVGAKHAGKLPYPLLSDLTKEVSKNYGILIDDKGFSLRGAYIIDPEGVLQWQVVHSTGVGRSTGEVVRVLQALQSGGICGVDWKPGQKHLTPP